MLYRQGKRNNPKKRAIHLNRPMKRLWRKVDNPTRPDRKIRFPAMPLLTPECIIFLFFNFEDSRQKRCTHTRETFFYLKIYLSKNHAKTYIFLNKTYNKLIYVYISDCYISNPNYMLTHV